MENKIVKQNVDNVSLQNILDKHLINPIKQQFKNNKEYIMRLEKEIKEKEESYDDLVAELANELIEETKAFFSEDLTKAAKEQVKKVKEANKNAKKERKTKSTTK